MPGTLQDLIDANGWAVITLPEQLPAGEYYIGDSAYALSEVNHDSLLERVTEGVEGFPESLDNYPTIHFDATLGLIEVGTCTGDGIFYDQDDFRYPVDSGAISAVPASAFEPEGKCLPNADYRECGEVRWDNNPNTSGGYGRWVAFDEPFSCGRNGDGEIFFGDKVFIQVL